MSKFRRFVTSGVGLTFLVVGVTGVLFQFFFETRPLVQIHAWLGVAMVAVALIHILQNWRSMLGHLRDWRVYSLVIPAGLAIWYVSQHSHKDGRREMAGRGPRTEEGRGEGNSRREAGGDTGQERRRSEREFVAKLSSAHADGLASAFDKDITAVVAAMKSVGVQVDDIHGPSRISPGRTTGRQSKSSSISFNRLSAKKSLPLGFPALLSEKLTLGYTGPPE